MCRHRVILFKHCVDMINRHCENVPMIRCRLVRGSHDGTHHAWNTVFVPGSHWNVVELMEGSSPQLYETGDDCITSYKRVGGGAGQTSIGGAEFDQSATLLALFGESKVKLGTGGFATVYRSKDKGWKGLTVAVKTFTRDLKTDSALEQAKKELMVLSRLEHPFIVACFGGHFQKNEQPHILLEYCEGGDIGQHHGKLNNHKIWTIGSQIAMVISPALDSI